MPRCSHIGIIIVAIAYATAISGTSLSAQQRPANPLPQPNSHGELIGTEFEQELKIPGWEYDGGALLVEPVWYSQYRRNDSHLIVMEWALPRKPGSTYGHFRVTDVLLIPTIAKDLTLAFDCRPPRKNVFEKIFAVVRQNDRQKWWRDVRQAWKVDLGTGLISPVSVEGIACLNEGADAEP